MERINSYPKVYNLGHPAIRNLFDDDVVVEEKVDGSQFSFGVFDGELKCRSRNQQLVLDAAGMFQTGVDALQYIKNDLVDGWVYRGEYLSKPKHNSLTYERVPKNHVILWDIMTGHEDYASRKIKEQEAERLGLDIVPLIHDGPLAMSLEQLDEWLEMESTLGGVNVEGVVIKSRRMFGRDGKMLAGKYVSEAFKEVNEKNYEKTNPGSKAILAMVQDFVRSEARWRKSVERMRDDGLLDNEPKDIGKIIKEIQKDVIEECDEPVKQQLWSWAKPYVTRGCIAGFPEWYKRLLVEQSIKDDE